MKTGVVSLMTTLTLTLVLTTSDDVMESKKMN